AFAELMLFDPQGAPFLLCDSRQGLCDPGEALAMLADSGSLVSAVYRSREPLLLPGATANPNVLARLEQDGFTSAMAAPLKHHGKLLGTLVVGLESERRLSDSDLRMLRSIGEQ